MTEPDPLEAMRQVAREVLREVVPEMLAASRAENGQAGANGHAREPIPQVPAPPVAAVLRPSTWTAPPAPGEVIGDGAARSEAAAEPEERPPSVDSGAEAVTLDTDADLERFVRALLARFENPRDRRDIRAGRIRFRIRRTAAASRGAEKPTLRIAKGAVTERVVRDAAERGLKLVLARGAVLTPLARDQARALGVEIEKEGRC
ncbi:MAG TPA: hypothetical protein VG388_13195 [Solirubrobacteraceae bacterium]|nr:hypothetical protein [Solirubrobacteraceae bacterium]